MSSVGTQATFTHINISTSWFMSRPLHFAIYQTDENKKKNFKIIYFTFKFTNSFNLISSGKSITFL